MKTTTRLVRWTTLGFGIWASCAFAIVACSSSDDTPPRETPSNDAGGTPTDAASADVAVNDAASDTGAEVIVDAAVDPVACSVTPCVLELAAGASSVCARVEDGTVRCWGSNASGELGRGPEGGDLSGTPSAVAGLANVTQLSGAISVPSDAYCARRSDGTVACWGSNTFGVLGRVVDGAVDVESSPTAMAVEGASGVASIAIGRSMACAAHTTSGMTCWGDNVSGQMPGQPLGDGVPFGPSRLDSVGKLDALALADRGTVALASNASLESWGLRGDMFGPGVGVLGREVSLDVAPPGRIDLAHASAVAASEGRACAIANGQVHCWGVGANGTSSVYPSPVALSAPKGVYAQTIAVGRKTACATLSDGSARCWGDNTRGQLGGGDSEVHFGAVVVAGLSARPVRMVTMDSATCAVLVTGGVQCWGGNSLGQLGIGKADPLTHLQPETVGISP
ncbi:regulator of chromosome condensation RCC1 [Labilithrix luteola]|uniref:Regulator of chromosome condensation RCC1 n=1 Tax=Labilithrix luteola TaxID=1391654 RepID=A0A0K1QE27_9BACT|nr:hypothetical protein [Labilithrix luteola]AKV04014.1 regulator of chromosome condensation RCC1 [Labilithrix luteola]